MRIFISGGCKNGKSYYAQRLAKAQEGGGDLYYVATMAPVDPEDDERIKRHRKERDGWGFTTMEQPVDIGDILKKCDNSGSFLLDSLTALLFNEMVLDETEGHNDAARRTLTGLSRIMDGIGNMVIVSDYIYSDAMSYDPMTEEYIKTLAEIDRFAAKNCDAVIEIAYSSLIVHKCAEDFGELYEKIL